MKNLIIKNTNKLSKQRNKFKKMNSTANRLTKPPVPKFNMIGAGTDTPDSSEPDTEATHSVGVQAVPGTQNDKSLSMKDNKVSKKLATLIEVLDI